MLDNSLPYTLQFQLRADILKKIQTGEWSTGQLIPSERELCNEYGVSRITVREVLKSLTQSGYLVRKQGVGTFVASAKVEYVMTSNYSLREDLKERGAVDKFIMLSYSKVKINQYFSQLFNISKDEDIVVVIRIREINGKKYAWEKSVIPSRYLGSATEEDIDRDGLYPTIRRCSNLFPEDAEEIIEAVNCPDNIARDMNLKKNTAVIQVTRKTTAQGRCIEYCESYLDGQRYICKHKIQQNWE